MQGTEFNAPRARRNGAGHTQPCTVQGVQGAKAYPARARAGGAQSFEPSTTLHATARRVVASPSDPSGAGTAATVVREAATETYHLAASQRIRIGYISCGPGEPLCGTTSALQECLDTLFQVALEVTCWLCALIAKRDGITVAAGDAA